MRTTFACFLPWLRPTSMPSLLQRLQGEVFLFMDLCGSLLATLHL